MSSSNLADRIRLNRKSRSPVQDTVEKHFDEISRVIAGGGSYRELHVQLTREGHNVGRKHNSLFTAFKVVKARREQSPPSTAATSSEIPTAVIDTRRKTTDW